MYKNKWVWKIAGKKLHIGIARQVPVSRAQIAFLLDIWRPFEI